VARLGSFAAPVDLPDHLRPWRAAGLDALFLPGGLPEPLPEALPAAGTSPGATIGGAQTQPVRQAVGGHCPPLPLAAPATDLDWPEPWRAIAARVRTKPQIIITYSSLMADVTGKADPARRKLFQSILAYMGWPQGTSLFWPCTDTPASPGLARNIFLNGALSYGVTHVACFGDEAARIGSALFPPGSGDPEIRVLTLPAPEELIELLPHEMHRAVALLKALPLV